MKLSKYIRGTYLRFAHCHIVWSLSQHYKEMKKRILADTLNSNLWNQQNSCYTIPASPPPA